MEHEHTKLRDRPTGVELCFEQCSAQAAAKTAQHRIHRQGLLALFHPTLRATGKSAQKCGTSGLHILHNAAELIILMDGWMD